MSSGSEAEKLNRAWWNSLARLHEADGYYDVSAFLEGGLTLDERERGEVERAAGQLAGRSLLHLQCHIGLDTLSWARLGARVTGVDFSENAIGSAREIARAAGLTATFVVANAQRLPADLFGRFDIAFASYGVFYWIEDLDAWMRSAAAVLRPGGSLVIVESHPLVQMFESADPVVADFPYAGAEPRRRPVTSTYSGHQLAASESETIGFAHGIGELVTSVAQAGLSVESLREYLDRDRPSHRPGKPLTRDAAGRYRLIIGGEAVPVTYSLRATKR
jgi:ubiquinone/menaquinone biosynthesis C-methylase UbiE